MATWQPDPSFYPSPRLAAKAPPEKLAYVAAFDPDRKSPDSIAVVDVDPDSASYSHIIGKVDVTHAGDEFHHFGWNACSSCLCPNAPHPHVERRYLVVPGLRSSRIYILDTKPDPRKPQIVKVIEPQDIAEKTGYTRPHTVHCGPGGIYVAALGNKDGKAPGGVFVMDHETFEPLGRWEVDRGPQQLGYDAWWHLGFDTMVTSEWGSPIHLKMDWCQKFCLAANTAGACISGISPSASIYKRSISAKSTSWFSNYARRTIRPSRTVSSTASSVSKIYPHRSGPGTATAISGQ